MPMRDASPPSTPYRASSHGDSVRGPLLPTVAGVGVFPEATQQPRPWRTVSLRVRLSTAAKYSNDRADHRGSTSPMHTQRASPPRSVRHRPSLCKQGVRGSSPLGSTLGSTHPWLHSE